MAGLTEVLTEARALGFLGPGGVEAHIVHAHGFARAFEEAPARFADLGSGGGVPGLVLASLWPEALGALVDANERRTAFLERATAALGFQDRVVVVRGRAEELGRDAQHRGLYDAVVARGFGPPPVTAECAAPLLLVGGRLVVSEPPEEAGRWDAAGLSKLGLERGPVVQAEARYQVLVQAELCGERYPRRVGIPSKRPLW
ncbi:MAG TPA: RsmG family class I SAM-dependent methyltransferase [Acidimicrobiales bacterium]|jgi:16S rRNA (guanine527-N7)-methyltransferase|nr:RsmG family class I SAM-dependent methyltransferase [Acidimicrobiales bacterium]